MTTNNNGIAKPYIYCDIHEPRDMSMFLHKTCNPITMNNEPSGLADYWWNIQLKGQLGIAMWERKKANELLMTIGRKLDTQLIKYRTSHPTALVGVLQEGLILPTQDGRCQGYSIRNGRNGVKILVPLRPSTMQYAAYRAYINARMLEGIPFIITTNLEDTALTMAAMLYNSVSNHDGLNHFTSTNVPKEMLKKFPLIRQLMSINGIGVATASDLLNDYGTPWKVYNQPYHMLATMENDRIATAVFDGIGKQKPGK